MIFLRFFCWLVGFLLGLVWFCFVLLYFVCFWCFLWGLFFSPSFYMLPETHLAVVEYGIEQQGVSAGRGCKFILNCCFSERGLGCWGKLGLGLEREKLMCNWEFPLMVLQGRIMCPVFTVYSHWRSWSLWWPNQDQSLCFWHKLVNLVQREQLTSRQFWCSSLSLGTTLFVVVLCITV